MINKQERNLLEFAENLNIVVLKNEPMAKHTTFKIGGRADFFITADTEGLKDMSRLKMNVTVEQH